MFLFLIYFYDVYIFKFFNAPAEKKKKKKRRKKKKNLGVTTAYEGAFQAVAALEK